MGTWELLDQAAGEGRALQVRLTPGAYVKPVKRAPGRPRTRGAVRYGHYVGYRPEKGGRPRCALKGCGKWLKKDQRLACCQEHEAQVVEEAKALLAKVAP